MKTSEKHPVLYHYTSCAGFEGIVRSQTLWAKFFRDLNDTTELYHVRGRLLGAIVPALKRFIKANRRQAKPAIREMGGINELAVHDANAVLDAVYEASFGPAKIDTSFPTYVTSFCSHIDDADGYTRQNGLLSMWRGYGSSGGIALVFDTQGLEFQMERESRRFPYNVLSIGDVVYDGYEDLFLNEFREYLEVVVEQAVAMVIGDSSKRITAEFVLAFLQMATRFKHRAFFEEREVRIVASPWTQHEFDMADDSDRAGRQVKKSFTGNGSTFIELFGSSTGGLPIKKVIIGPHRNQAATLKSVRTLLSRRDDIEISCSLTPYLEAAQGTLRSPS